MRTEISYVDGKLLRAECGYYGWFTCEAGDFCKRHEGVWNSRVFAFVPETKFSDGVPVVSYEQFF